MDCRRVESFSDGVFAVAITVLVFNLLPIADKSIHNFTELFRDNWPQYAAYVGSFLTIGIMWLNHHTMISYLDRVDRTVLVLNGLLLMGVVAVPFPTALISSALGAHPTVSAKVAAVAYGVLLTAMSIAFASMWLYITAHQDKLATRPIAASMRSTIRFTGGLVAYVAATLIGFVWPVVSVIIYGAVAVYYVFEHLPPPPDADQAAAEAPGTPPVG
jgi:TMEM175 potassium channel family protein